MGSNMKSRGSTREEKEEVLKTGNRGGKGREGGGG